MSAQRRAAWWAVLLLALAVGAPAVLGGDDAGGPAQKRRERDRLLEQFQQMLREGKRAEAIALAEKALAIQRDLYGDDHDEVARSLGSLAELQEEEEDFDGARKLREQAAAIEAKLHGDKDWRTMDSRRALADVSRLAALDSGQRGRLADAHRKIHRAVELEGQGKYREALALTEAARDARKELLGEDHPDYAASLGNLAVLQQDLGEYDAAESSAMLALKIVKKSLGESHPRYALALNGLGALYNQLGYSDRAKPRLEQALEAYRAFGAESYSDFATVLNNLAVMYMNDGAYSDAEGYYRKCLAMLKTAHGENDFHYFMGKNNLAVLYRKLGRYRQAEDTLREAMAGYERAPGGKRHPDYAVCLHNLACLDIARKDYQKAEAPLLGALDIVKDREGDQSPAYANSLSVLGLVYTARGDYDRAESCVGEALKIRRRRLGECHPLYAHSLANLAAVDYARGKYARAEEHLSEALKIVEKALGRQHPDCAVLRWSLGAVFAATKRPAEARAMLGKSLAVEQGELRGVFSFSTESAMSDYLASAADTLDALLSVTPAGADAPAGEALTWVLRRKTAVFDAELRLCEAQQALAQDPEFADRVTRLRSRRQQLVNLTYDPPTDAVPGAQAKQQAALRDECADLQIDLTRALAKRRPVVDDSVDADAVRRALPAGSALVEFVRTRPFHFTALGKDGGRPPERYLAFVLAADPGIPPQLIDLGEAAAIDQQVGALRGIWELRGKVDEKDLEERFPDAAHPLYKLAFEPLREALGKAALVFLAPDGALNGVPFEALPDGPKGERWKYLIESYRFVYLPSGRDLLRPASKPGQGALVFSGPDYNLKAADRLAKVKEVLGKAPEPPGAGGPHRQSDGLRWKLLEYAPVETAAVRTMLKEAGYGEPQVYQGKEALEEVFKAKTRPAPRLLHVATHGFFFPLQDLDAEEDDVSGQLVRVGAAAGWGRIKTMAFPLLRSGLVLAGANEIGEGGPEAAAVDDGYLTAAEVGQLDLRGTDLVVLAACESGLGDVKAGTGVYGLRAAFFYAGARTLVTSLFHVPDEETMALMEAFYKGLKAGKGKSESLYAAERDLIRRRREANGAAHPFYWGAFILVGDP